MTRSQSRKHYTCTLSKSLCSSQSPMLLLFLLLLEFFIFHTFEFIHSIFSNFYFYLGLVEKFNLRKNCSSKQCELLPHPVILPQPIANKTCFYPHTPGDARYLLLLQSFNTPFVIQKSYLKNRV